MKKLLITILLLVLCFPITSIGCNNTPQPSDQGEYSQSTYKLTSISDKINFLGRTSIEKDGYTCDFTGSGINFKAYIDDKLTLNITCNNKTYFSVFVNGNKLPKRFESSSGGNAENITITGLGTMQLKEISIIKQNEAQTSLSIINSISFYGKLENPANQKDTYIEFIGDSIVCGYGNLVTIGTPNAGSATCQDGTQAYPFLTAQKLNADFSIIGCSGIGVDKGFTAFNQEEFFTKASYFRSTETEYNFTTARKPDIVVINLGTNDYSQGSTESNFISKATSLISLIRSTYSSNVPIIWCYDMMGNSCNDWILKTIENLGDIENNLFALKLDSDISAGDGHPSLSAHISASNTLYDFITKIVL